MKTLFKGMIFLCVLFFLEQVCFSSNIFINLQVKTNREGAQLSGAQAVESKLLDSSGSVIWSEKRDRVYFLNGLAGYKLGTVTPLYSHYFHPSGVTLSVTIEGSSHILPFYSVPFSLFSYGTDVAETLFNDGLFEINDDGTKYIKIGDGPAATRLDVAGGVRVGDTTVETDGVIRFHNDRFQVRKAPDWINLDFEIDPEYSSKWTTGADGIHYNGGNVGIGLSSPTHLLHVSGNAKIEGVLHLKEDLHLNKLNFKLGSPASHFFQQDGTAQFYSITIGASSWTKTGLVWNLITPGVLTGDGSQLTDLDVDHIDVDGVSGAKIADDVLTSDKIANGAVSSRVIDEDAINNTKFDGGLSFLSAHILDDAVTTNKVPVSTVQAADLSAGFLLLNDALADDVVDSVNLDNSTIKSAHIVTGSVTAIKVKDGSIVFPLIKSQNVLARHFQSLSVAEAHIATDSVTNLKIGGPITVDKGGTGVNAIAQGAVLFADTTSFVVNDDLLVWDTATKRLGVGIDTPTGLVHVKSLFPTAAVMTIRDTSSPAAADAQLTLKNTQREWKFITKADASGFVFHDQTGTAQRFIFDAAGKIGINTGTSALSEKLVVEGGVKVGAAQVTSPYPNPGTIQFVTGTSTLKGAVGFAFKGFNNDVFVWEGKSAGQNNNVHPSFGVTIGGEDNVSVTNPQGVIFGGKSNTIASGNTSVIGGGHSNLLDATSDFALYSGILGGESNSFIIPTTVVSGSHETFYLFIGGGFNNRIQDKHAFIGGGHSHLIASKYSAIWGGRSNSIGSGGSYLAINGGRDNLIQDSAHFSTIVGGRSNLIFTFSQDQVWGKGQQIVYFDSDDQIYTHTIASYIGGGAENQVGGSYSGLMGGLGNQLLGSYAVIGGGEYNRVSGDYSGVIVGRESVIEGNYSGVMGGSQNQVVGHYSQVSGGSGNTVQGNYGQISGGEKNTVLGRWSGISGGAGNAVYGDGHVIGGGEGNRVNGMYAVIGGGERNVLRGVYSGIMSGYGNYVEGDGSVVGGGVANHVRGYGNVLSGGEENRLDGSYGVISGGSHNEVAGDYGVISGGRYNEVAGDYGVVVGGKENRVSGEGSVAIGGEKNEVSGDYSVGMGSGSKVRHSGTFVWSDGSEAEGLESDGENRFMVRARGGVSFYTGEHEIGVVLESDGGSWAHVSDASKKEAFREESGEVVLRKLMDIPIRSWRYKGAEETVRHIGPTAQDFYAAYGLGSSDKHITAVDADGIALLAIQGLYRLSKQLPSQALSDQFNHYSNKIESLNKRLNYYQHKTFLLNEQLEVLELEQLQTIRFYRSLFLFVFSVCFVVSFMLAYRLF